MNQKLILVIVVCIGLNIYLRDITQTYVQLTISLNKEFYIRLLPELELNKNSILKVIKPLYEVLEAGAYWFNIYHNHHTKNLSMHTSIYDSCFLYNDTERFGIECFGVIDLQTNDSLIIENEVFVDAKKKRLKKNC